MGFSAEWLALREPADHKARDTKLLQRAARAAGPEPVILDLGCGTGSTVRALAPYLPATARWRLVDTDADLLMRAAISAGDRLQTYRLNLSDLDALPLEEVTLVTASALLDLMPEAWLRALSARLRVPFYAALSYNGQMSWHPSNALDDGVIEAFNRHQLSDKGLGPALGPNAVAVSAAIFADAGFDVLQAQSPWQLGSDQAPLHATLAEGIAAAAADSGAKDAAKWGAARMAGAAQTSCRIGHGDILTLPQMPAKESNNAVN
jgi:SAM-dependent methyltransferase